MKRSRGSASSECDKWLEDVIFDTVSAETSPFDFDKWKRKYPEEFEKLVSSAAQAQSAPFDGRPNI